MNYSAAGRAADRWMVECSRAAVDSGRRARSPWLVLLCVSNRGGGRGVFPPGRQDDCMDCRDVDPGSSWDFACTSAPGPCSQVARSSEARKRCASYGTVLPTTHLFARPLILRAGAMAGGLQWRNALARALKNEEGILRTSLSSQRRTFSSRPLNNYMSTHKRAQEAQWKLSNPTIQAFARNRRKFSSTPISRHNHLDPPKPGEEYISPTLHHRIPC